MNLAVARRWATAVPGNGVNSEEIFLIKKQQALCPCESNMGFHFYYTRVSLAAIEKEHPRRKTRTWRLFVLLFFFILIAGPGFHTVPHLFSFLSFFLSIRSLSPWRDTTAFISLRESIIFSVLYLKSLIITYFQTCPLGLPKQNNVIFPSVLPVERLGSCTFSHDFHKA